MIFIRGDNMDLFTVIVRLLVKEAEEAYNKSQLEKLETPEERRERLINEEVERLKKRDENIKFWIWVVIIIIILIFFFKTCK